ncbi:hypothetical protein CMV_021048 [Castanea mollissima]|uniref:F-box domain-containing protein n=1 Tax=Castanea mollissima TaxID=60419 RepID=A0A8J4QZN8_9ROSI|nr:hypothetical protein CMV_021048 [Castanea mollissima]
MDVVRCSSSLLQRLSIDDLPRLPIDDLPDCLLIEILTQLPLKSIFQCKCVSRRWCSLISAPSFAYIGHRLRSSSILQRTSTLLISHYNDGVRKVLMTSEEPEFKSLASLINQYYINNSSVSLDIVHASCHDLLLCTQTKLKLFSEVVDDVVYHVLNPITRQSIMLPPLRRPSSAWIGLIFRCYHDQQQFSYRVMRIPKFENVSTEFKADIFSSETGKWSESIVLCPPEFYFTDYAHSYAGVPYQGLLFWWSLDGHLLGFDPYTSTCCRVIYKPEDLAPNNRIQRLGVCNGALRICKLAGPSYADEILLVWELKDHDTECKWSLEHKVDVVYLIIETMVVSLNLRRKTVEMVCDFQRPSPFYKALNVFNFVLPCWPTPIPSSPFKE